MKGWQTLAEHVELDAHEQQRTDPNTPNMQAAHLVKNQLVNHANQLSSLSGSKPLNRIANTLESFDISSRRTVSHRAACEAAFPDLQRR